MATNSLNLPADMALPGDDTTASNAMPYVIVGDVAFPLERHIMKPYALRGLSDGNF